MWGSADWAGPGKFTRKDIQGRRCKIILIGLSLQGKGGLNEAFFLGPDHIAMALNILKSIS